MGSSTSGTLRFTQNKAKDKLFIIQLEMRKVGQQFILKTFSKEGIAKNEKINSIELIGSDEKIKWGKRMMD